VVWVPLGGTMYLLIVADVENESVSADEVDTVADAFCSKIEFVGAEEEEPRVQYSKPNCKGACV